MPLLLVLFYVMHKGNEMMDGWIHPIYLDLATANDQRKSMYPRHVIHVSRLNLLGTTTLLL